MRLGANIGGMKGNAAGIECRFHGVKDRISGLTAFIQREPHPRIQPPGIRLRSGRNKPQRAQTTGRLMVDRKTDLGAALNDGGKRRRIAEQEDREVHEGLKLKINWAQASIFMQLDRPFCSRRKSDKREMGRTFKSRS